MPAPKRLKIEQPVSPAGEVVLKRARRNIYWQAGLALVTVLLTVVIIFAMTAAWYTNIVQTSGLTFEVAAWGFDGDIVVNTAAIQAAPGDTGVVHLEMDNDTENIAAISVNVNKGKMAEMMQKRLYFYVDAQQQRNGETMERVYLNNQESYTYTVFANSALTLTELIHNDAQLKWEWVYDVLGYYVLGTPSEDGNTISVYEYLRPIEYDYDEATVTLVTDEAGKLQMEIATVDGLLTPEDYLVELSKTDGYAGTIDTTRKQYGYYPVVVDDAGYGIWAYLCSYSEIELNTQEDTALGQNAAKKDITEEELKALTFVAELNIAAQQDQSEPFPVSTLSGLNEAIASGAVDVIQLTNDITLSENESLVFAEGTRVMIDLNDHTITNTTDGGIVVDALAGSSVTLVNGAIDGGGDGYGVWTTGAEVTLSDVAVSNVVYGVYMADGATGTNDKDSKVRIVGCTLEGSVAGVLAVGNGTSSAQTTQLVVENSRIIGAQGYGIAGNGTATGNGKWGTDIQLINSYVEGQWAGIYHPQKDSTLTIYNCEVKGSVGIAIKGGTVTIDGENVEDENGIQTGGTTITGDGEEGVKEPAFAGGGFTDTGDGIYIETGYEFPVELTISGKTTVTGKSGFSLRVFEHTADWVTVTIGEGVTLSGQTLIPEVATEEPESDTTTETESE